MLTGLVTWSRRVSPSLMPPSPRASRTTSVASRRYCRLRARRRFVSSFQLLMLGSQHRSIASTVLRGPARSFRKSSGRTPVLPSPFLHSMLSSARCLPLTCGLLSALCVPPLSPCNTMRLCWPLCRLCRRHFATLAALCVYHMVWLPRHDCPFARRLLCLPHTRHLLSPITHAT